MFPVKSPVTLPVRLPENPPKDVTTPTKSASPDCDNVREVPTTIWLFCPSNFMEDVPMVKIPVTLASPLTIKSVLPLPIVTLANVVIPEADLILETVMLGLPRRPNEVVANETELSPVRLLPSPK